MVCKQCGSTIHVGSLCSVCRRKALGLRPEGTVLPESVATKLWFKIFLFLSVFITIATPVILLSKASPVIMSEINGQIWPFIISYCLLVVVLTVTSVLVIIGKYGAFYVLTLLYLIDTFVIIFGYNSFNSISVIVLRVVLCGYLLYESVRRMKIRKIEQSKRLEEVP